MCVCGDTIPREGVGEDGQSGMLGVCYGYDSVHIRQYFGCCWPDFCQ